MLKLQIDQESMCWKYSLPTSDTLKTSKKIEQRDFDVKSSICKI